MTNAKQDPKTGEKKKRTMREKTYVVQRAVQVVDLNGLSELIGTVCNPDSYDETLGHDEVAVFIKNRLSDTIEELGFDCWEQVAECENFTSCDKWIDDNGEDGEVYRAAIITRPVKVKTETITKRVVESIE